MHTRIVAIMVLGVVSGLVPATITTFDNAGNWQRKGTATFGSDGNIDQRLGPTAFDSNGNVWQHIGAMLIGPNGQVCQTINSSVYCHSIPAQRRP